MQNNKQGVLHQLIALWVRSTSWMKITGIILVILAVGTSLQVVYTNQVRRDLLECQVQFMDQTVKSLETRSSSNAEANEALESLIRGIKDSRAENSVQKLFDEYLDKREKQRQAQLDNPYPTIVLSEFCYSE